MFWTIFRILNLYSPKVVLREHVYSSRLMEGKLSVHSMKMSYFKIPLTPNETIRSQAQRFYVSESHSLNDTDVDVGTYHRYFFNVEFAVLSRQTTFIHPARSVSLIDTFNPLSYTFLFFFSIRYMPDALWSDTLVRNISA